MWSPKLRGPVAHILRFSKVTLMHKVVGVLCLAMIVGVLVAACGTAATGQTQAATPTPTFAPSPTATPTQAPTPKPTPTAAPQPTQPPPAPTPAILDLRPASMSIVGHLDCQRQGAFVCFARVISRSSNQSDLHWVAFTNVPGGVSFSPVSGVLAPGQSVLVTITVPFNTCTQGLFFFQGPINTHTITWAC